MVPSVCSPLTWPVTGVRCGSESGHSETKAPVSSPAPESVSHQSRRRRRKHRKNNVSSTIASRAPGLQQDIISKVVESESSSQVLSRANSYRGDGQDEVGEPLEDWGAVAQLADNEERSNEMVVKLEESTSGMKHQIIACMFKHVGKLSVSRYGCRVVQKALEVASPVDRNLLVEKLQPDCLALYEDLHGNHVFAKMVAVMPASSQFVRYVIESLQGRAVTVARHRFGCRILERLIEHVPHEEMSILLDAIINDAEALCRHPFANFVVQHLFEHGSRACQSAILNNMIKQLPILAKHRTASHVVQRALDYCSDTDQKKIARALLHSQPPHSFVDVACSRYGSFVVEQLASLRDCLDEMRQNLLAELGVLGESQFGKRVIERYGLIQDPVVAEDVAVN